jgi:hypothetical protein
LPYRRASLPRGIVERDGELYGRVTWPPRGRGRGESLSSPRRIVGKIRQGLAVRLRGRGMTYREIALRVGYADKSVARRAIVAAVERRWMWDPAS